jgi:DNA-directed RNA polymerase subunit F
MAKRILGKEAISNPEMKNALSIEEDMGSLQRRTFEYVNKFSKVDGEKALILKKKLLEIGDITEEEAVMIVNLMPRASEEIRDIFHHRKTILPREFVDKILEVINEVMSQ